MKRFLPIVALVSACTGPTYLPDGGRVRQTCQDIPTNIVVKVQDAMGMAIPDATVTAKNQNNGQEVVTTTGGDGRTTAGTDDLGNGQVSITATAGSLKTKQAYIVTITCGECDCSVTPSAAVLTLE